MNLIVSQVDTDAVPKLQQQVEELSNENQLLKARYAELEHHSREVSRELKTVQDVLFNLKRDFEVKKNKDE